jgi:NADPH:quinone reductase-like Zn-dependent oxidoreductase
MMSSWPEQLPFPGAKELHHYLNPEGEDVFSWEEGTWPNVQRHPTLPLHVIKVCAVAIHRDELKLTEEERNAPVPVRRIPGYEFSGYVVSATPGSSLPPKTKV